MNEGMAILKPQFRCDFLRIFDMLRIRGKHKDMKIQRTTLTPRTCPYGSETIPTTVRLDLLHQQRVCLTTSLVPVRY